MNYPELPSQPEDTQPVTPDTRPTIPHRRSHGRQRLWTMGLLAIVSAFSLLATSVLLLSGGWRSTPADPLSITLLRGTQTSTIQTQVQTIAELLREQNIVLSAEEMLQQAPETMLTDGMEITIATLRSVTLTIDGQVQNLRTIYSNPLDILTGVDISIQTTDRIWLDGSEISIENLALWPIPVSEIVIQHPRSVTIRDGDQQTDILTHAETVGDALFEAGIAIYLTDRVVPEVSAPLPEDGNILIDRARSVTIQVDGISIETRVRGTTVADALTESGVPLLGLDYTIPPEDAAIEAGMQISVLRVTEAIESYEETIPYETSYQADAELELDTQVILQGGQFGRRRYDERVRYENGVEVGREAIGVEVVQQAVNETIAYGTRIVIRTVDTPEGPREYWRRLRMYATSYHPAALGGDDRTSIGETLRRGIVASVPAVIPYRTNVFVPGYGLGMMADTGGIRSTPYWIDLGYGDEDFVSWSRYVDVYLLTPVPANVTYLLPDWRPVRGRPDE